MYEYNATITRVVDGDTFTATVDLGFHVSVSYTFRLFGIDTPETRTRDLEEKTAGNKAKERVIELMPVGKEVRVKVSAFGKFGRPLADVTLADGRNLTELLISEDLGEAYYGGKKTTFTA